MYIRKKGSKFYFTLTVTNPDGTARRIERVGGKTRRETTLKAREFMKQLDRFNELHEIKKITLKDYCKEWLENFQESGASINTIKAYERFLMLHLVPALGATRLHNIQPIMLQRFLSEKAQKYAHNTVELYYHILRKFFEDAVNEYEYLDKSPARNLKLPLAMDDTKTKKVFSPEDMQLIFKQFPVDHPLHVVIQLGYRMGMRLGECLGLTWDNVSFEDGTIFVNQNLYDHDTAPEILPRTKSKKPRKLVMDDQMADILRHQKKWQARNQLLLGRGYKKTRCVCTDGTGEPLTSANVRWFNLWCQENKLNGSFHTLRHTHATRMLEAGFDLDFVSKRLGHSSPVTTSTTYSHMTAKRQKAAKEKLNQIL